MKTTLMTASVIFISLMLAGTSYAYGPENVMAIWLLDENGGDKAGDSSGNGNDGVLNGDPEWTEGVFGSALEFNGTNQVIIQDHPTLDAELNDGFTFVCWERMSTDDSDGGFLVKEEGWKNKMCYRFYLSHGSKFGFVLVGQDGTIMEPEVGTPEVDVWQHVAAVYDGAILIPYQDGERILTKVDGIPWDKGIADTDARAFIGSGHPNGEFFSGALDELALFNVVLSQDEIQAIMNDGLENTALRKVEAVSPADKLATTWGKIKYE